MARREGGRTDAPYQKRWSRLRIIVQTPRAGYHHPAGRQDVLEMLKAVGPVAFYGLLCY
jgi:hypothetical protein